MRNSGIFLVAILTMKFKYVLISSSGQAAKLFSVPELQNAQVNRLGIFHFGTVIRNYLLMSNWNEKKHPKALLFLTSLN